MVFDSGFVFNIVVWITSLPGSELGPSRRMTEDMEALAGQYKFQLISLELYNVRQLSAALEDLAIHASIDGWRPILVLDMHGKKDRGLMMASGEDVSWECLSNYFTKVNIATGNNLCIIGAACFTFHAIQAVHINQPTPFFMLIAPEARVNVGFLLDNIVKFFSSLFVTGSITAAFTHIGM